MIKVGLSARILSRAPENFGIGPKSIQYLEQSMANAIARSGSLVFLIPSIGTSTELSSEYFHPMEYARELDGLVLQGGIDVCPSMYGESPISGEIVWDSLRDRYEIALIEAFVSLKKPVLGICRGMQLINIFMGGSLVQDIPSQLKSRITHLCERNRERNLHPLEILPGSYLSRLYGATGLQVNSIHHQCVKRLGRNLKVEAICPEDGVIEAIRYTGDSYLVGVQWHPEFHHQVDSKTFDADILFSDFVRHAKERSQDSSDSQIQKPA